MSVDAGNSSRSRHSNGSYPASDSRDAKTPDSQNGVPSETARPDVPTPEERVEGILDEYPDRVLRPVSTTHGRKLRAEAVGEAETVDREVPVGESGTKTVSDTVERPALPWVALIEEFLQDYEGYRDRALRMARGHDRHGDYESFEVPLENSFSPEYQSRQYARLKALKRMFLGESADESPTGEEYPGAFDEPATVLFGLTASTTPDGEYAPVVDHDRGVRNAWSGSDGVRRTLRYVLQDKLGLESTDYAWWWQSEPHPGGGAAAGYSHSHPVVILDTAAVTTDVDPGDLETYRPVVAKHVAECESAEWSAHRIREGSDKSAVKVREADEITDFAGYVSEYLQVDPETDLLERSDEYLMWAAAQWASTTQKYSKSRTATAGIRADRCHQEYVDDDAEQSHDHGERVVRSERRGVEYECAECGSEFAVDQSPGTLVEARRAAADGGTVTASAESAETEPHDGATATVVRFDHEPVLLPAVDTGECDAAQSGEKRTLRERWPSARGGARAGGETTVVRTRPEEHERTPDFSPVRWGGETYCSACGETDPDGECSAAAYKQASYEGYCPVPPEHYGEHTVVEQYDEEYDPHPDDRAHHTGEGYHGNGHTEMVPLPAVLRGSESESFTRPPSWRPEAIVQQQTGEETVIGTPGGVDYAEVVVEGVDAISPERLVDPDILRGPKPWERRRGCAECGSPGSELVHTASEPTAVCEECGRECDPPDPLPFTEEQVRSGEVPPPELIDRQLAEVHHGERVTAKEWSDDWYAERYETVDEQDGGDGGPLPWEQIKQYRERHPAATVTELVEEFDVPAGRRELVGGVIGPPTNHKTS
jgi:hypothetical protein